MFVFSVRDARTRMVLHRCDSPVVLYPGHSPTSSVVAPMALSAGVALWHTRLGHPNIATLRHILRSFSFTCNKVDDHTCRACRLSKHVRLPFSTSSHVASYPFELIHSDVLTSLIRLQCIYNFWLLHATLSTVLDYIGLYFPLLYYFWD